MKTYWESGGTAPHILNLGTRWRWVVSFTPRPLYPQGKSPQYPLDRRLGGLQSRSGRGVKEKNSQSLPVLERPIIQPVAQRYTTELSRRREESQLLLGIEPLSSSKLFLFFHAVATAYWDESRLLCGRNEYVTHRRQTDRQTDRQTYGLPIEKPWSRIQSVPENLTVFEI
jgi:hypothetical protein